MYDEFSDGYCPECLLDDKKIPMVINRGDLWECPECHLQACGGGGAAPFVIMRIRGTGQLIPEGKKATDHICGCILDRAQKGLTTRHRYSPDGTGFDSEEDLRQFLKNEVK